MTAAGALFLVRSPAGDDAASERAYVLLRNNRLLVIDTATGREVDRRALAARAGEAFVSGPRMAVGTGGRTLYALVDTEPDAVAIVDADTLRVRRRVELEPRIRYRVLMLARDGTLYLAGNRPRRVGSDAVVTRVPPGRRPKTVTLRKGEPHDWFIYAAALSGDGGRLIVSYHGGCGEGRVRCTGGGDAIETSTLARCTGQAFRDSGCVGDIHGLVEPYGDGWIAARGEPRVGLLDGAGRTRETIDTELQTHLMDFALAGKTLYALGDCFKGAGIRALSPATGSSRTVGPASICGVGIAAGRRSLVVIRRDVTVPLGPRLHRGIVLLDRRTGRLVRELRTQSTPLDVLVRAASGEET